MRSLAVTALLAILASCLTETDEQRRAELETSSFTQELSACASSCDPPLYNGVPVSCASNAGCYGGPDGVACGPSWQFIACEPASACGNEICEDGLGEDSSSCPSDCFCGNGTCDSGEQPNTCYDCNDGMPGCYYDRHGWVCW